MKKKSKKVVPMKELPKKLFKVTVQKQQYCSGVVIVRAVDVNEAIDNVERAINSGLLQTTAVNWGEPEYVDGSFQTSGDVEEA